MADDTLIPAAAGGPRPPEAGALAPPASTVRRRLGRALLLASLAFAAGSTLAQPFQGRRMSPDERERFRRELRQPPGPGGPARDAGPRPQRMSPGERDQLRQQLREARPDDRRGRGRRRD